MDIQAAITDLVAARDLDATDMQSAMRQIMGGEASPAQIGAFLVALRIKGETIEEIAAATAVMRELATPVMVSADNLVDIVGTGGDGANLFNVSTASSFVVAAAGGHVAKHGNRSVSSTSGSSDVLQQLGVKLELNPEQVARCIEQVGMGFMFAPAHHSAMKHAAGPRKDLGLRTIFNMLGPMTNPAGVKRQVIGVYDAALCRPMAEVLKQLGSEHIMVVHSDEGLDEISIAGGTQVVELRDGTISEYRVKPEDFKLQPASLDDLKVGSAEQSVALIRGALSGAEDAPSQAAARMIMLNAGAAIYISGVAATLADGVQMADDAIASGAAKLKITELVQFTELAVAAG